MKYSADPRVVVVTDPDTDTFVPEFPDAVLEPPCGTAVFAPLSTRTASISIAAPVSLPRLNVTVMEPGADTQGRVKNPIVANAAAAEIAGPGVHVPLAVSDTDSGGNEPGAVA
jgi:hypothetical protein